MINSEDDVRAYVREASGGKARWVEPALGSTPGLPDCWVPLNKDVPRNDVERAVHFELKSGTLKGGKLCFTVRPEQRREIKALIRDKVPVGFIVGVEGTTSVAFMAATVESLTGKVALGGSQTPYLWADADNKDRFVFLDKVYFIFLDFVEFGVVRGAKMAPGTGSKDQGG